MTGGEAGWTCKRSTLEGLGIVRGAGVPFLPEHRPRHPQLKVYVARFVTLIRHRRNRLILDVRPRNGRPDGDAKDGF
jgi:hypothetical protein